MKVSVIHRKAIAPWRGQKSVSALGTSTWDSPSSACLCPVVPHSRTFHYQEILLTSAVPPDPCCVVTVLRAHCASQHPTPRNKYLPVLNCSCPCCFHACHPHAYFSSKHHVHMSHSCIMNTWLIYTWCLHVSFMYLIHTPCLHISFTYFVYMPCPYSHLYITHPCMIATCLTHAPCPYTMSTYLGHLLHPHIMSTCFAHMPHLLTHISCMCLSHISHAPGCLTLSSSLSCYLSAGWVKVSGCEL